MQIKYFMDRKLVVTKSVLTCLNMVCQYQYFIEFWKLRIVVDKLQLVTQDSIEIIGSRGPGDPRSCLASYLLLGEEMVVSFPPRLTATVAWWG
jgi:hypothetical protein